MLVKDLDLGDCLLYQVDRKPSYYESYTISNKSPDACVVYTKGYLHRFNPSGNSEGTQGRGIAIPPFTEDGTYHFISGEEGAGWVCIAPISGSNARARCNYLTEENEGLGISGRCFVAEGSWEIGGTVYKEGELVLDGEPLPLETRAVLSEGFVRGVLVYDIRTELKE